MEPRCRRSVLPGRAVLVLVALALVALLAGCGGEDEAAVDDEVGVEDELVDDVAGVEAEFDGQALRVGEEVTVSGEVIDLVGAHGFRLQSDTAEETLLVVTREMTAVKKDSVVQVTGTVHLLDVAALVLELLGAMGSVARFAS